MAEFALGQREGALDRKTAEIKEICREELARLEEAEESRKHQRPPDADDMVLTHVQTAEERAAESLKRAEREGTVIEIADDSPKKAGPPAPSGPESHPELRASDNAQLYVTVVLYPRRGLRVRDVVSGQRRAR